MKLSIINPATETLITEVNTTTQSQLSDFFTKAKNLQPRWSKQPLAKRADCIRKFCELLARDKSECASILSDEMGKPIKQALGEVEGTLMRTKWFLDHCTEKNIQWEETVFQEGTMTEKITYEPLGTIANISAWNYPYFVGSNVFVPALLTGNAVIYKPSEWTTLTGLKIEALLKDSLGEYKDVFAAVIGAREVGEWILDLPIDGVFFTGSKGTGEKIAQRTAKRFIKTQLELGGKDPAYICEDVDVKAAAEGTADGAFYNAGQSCCAVERIYVRSEIYDAFIGHFVESVKNMKMGSPRDESTYLGPLVRKEQLGFLNMQVQDAVAKGAKAIVQGGVVSGQKGWFYAPTVLTNVNSSMFLMQEESFGPVIGIQKVSSDAEALELMNDSAFGLTSSVYTKDAKRAQSLMRDLNSGTVYWNCCDRVSPNLPWTGRKGSGIGSTLSTIGIMAFLQPKAWHLRS